MLMYSNLLALGFTGVKGLLSYAIILALFIISVNNYLFLILI